MAENAACIYAIVNTDNGKVYIGSAVRPEKRWNEHRRKLRLGIHHSMHLQNAWDLHTEEKFMFHVLERVEDTTEIYEKEQVWLDCIKPYMRENGYNVSCNAKKVMLGRQHSEAVKRAMSESRKGRKSYVRSAETCEKISRANTGRKMPAAQVAAMGIRMRGENNPNYGKPMSEEQKSKIRATIGTTRKGRNNANSKYNEKDAETVKRRRAEGATYARISAELGVTYKTIVRWVGSDGMRANTKSGNKNNAK